MATQAEIGTEQIAAILIVVLILMTGLYVFVGAGKSGDRVVCTAWKIRTDGAFEAETNSGTILFRRKEIHLIEPYKIDGEAWVCIGNLQRMVWADFPSESEAHRFVSQMEQHLSQRAI